METDGNGATATRSYTLFGTGTFQEAAGVQVLGEASWRSDGFGSVLPKLMNVLQCSVYTVDTRILRFLIILDDS